MKWWLFYVIWGCTLLLICPARQAFAVDQYVGDTAIYGGTNAQNMKPNVLFIIDNSREMENTTSTSVYYDTDGDGQPDYSNTRPTYDGSYETDGIYKVVSLGNYTHMNNPSLSEVEAHCSTAYHDLYYYGSTLTYLDNNGYCDDRHNALMYALGNYLNFRESSPTSTLSAIEQVNQAVKYAADQAKKYVNIGLMTFGSNNKGGESCLQSTRC